MHTGTISQKQININIFILFTVAIILASLAAQHIYACNKEELEIEQYKSRCEELSNQLVEISSSLTEEVRNFVINEDIEALENYWNEVEHVKNRENLIVELENMNLPSKEMRLLNVAKENSDLSGYTQIRAMRLVLDTMYADESWLPQQVREYVLNIIEKEMTDKEKKNAALQLLFGTQFNFEKNMMMHNVEDFQKTMQQRLDQELTKARELTRSAMGMLFALLGIILCLVGLVILVFARMVVHPIQAYSDTLLHSGEYPVLKPFGVKETQIFAETFNELLDKLQEASAAKSSFVSAMSHEIRTPLNTINGYKYLLEDSDLTEMQKDYIDQIQLATGQLLHIVNQTLDFSRLEQDKLSTEEVNFDLEKLCKEVQQMFYPEAERKGLYLKLHLEDTKHLWLKGDEGKLRQILINLTSNGIKFTSKGGVCIRVKAKNFSKKEEADSETQLVIKIVDTGIGIQEEAKDKIFSAFEQADSSIHRKYGGTGLGLAITQQMVHLMKGNIRLDTQVGRGTTFTIQIPLKEGVKEVKHAVILPKYYGKRVLLVEDNQINARMEKELLQRHELIVHVADSGEQAVLNAKTICYDVIFMDIQMSGIDGYAAVKAIRSEGNSRFSYITALTADAEEKAVKLAYDAGMNGYLTKPFTPENITDVLKDALGESQKPLLDTVAPLKRMLGEKKLYKELLEAFLAIHRDDFDTLRQWEDSSKSVIALLHELKGLCGTLGIVQLQEVLKSAEIKEYDSEIGNQIWEVYQETCIEIQKYLSKDTDESKVDDVQNEIADRQANDIITRMQDALEEGDVAAIDLLMENSEVLRSLLGAGNYKHFNQTVRCFDWDAALIILKKEVG